MGSGGVENVDVTTIGIAAVVVLMLLKEVRGIIAAALANRKNGNGSRSPRPTRENSSGSKVELWLRRAMETQGQTDSLAKIGNHVEQQTSILTQHGELLRMMLDEQRSIRCSLDKQGQSIESLSAEVGGLKRAEAE